MSKLTTIPTLDPTAMKRRRNFLGLWCGKTLQVRLDVFWREKCSTHKRKNEGEKKA